MPIRNIYNLFFYSQPYYTVFSYRLSNFCSSILFLSSEQLLFPAPFYEVSLLVNYHSTNLLSSFPTKYLTSSLPNSNLPFSVKVTTWSSMEALHSLCTLLPKNIFLQPAHFPHSFFMNYDTVKVPCKQTHNLPFLCKFV